MSRKPSREQLERRIDGLEEAREKDRLDYQKTLAAKNDQLRSLRESWELLDTFPELGDFLAVLHKIRDAAGPLRSPSYQPGRNADALTAAERGAFPDGDRSRVTGVRRSLEGWTVNLLDRITPKGKLVDTEHEEIPPPVCHNPDCEARMVPQSFDAEACRNCHHGFTEFRPGTKSRRCWIRTCPFYSRSDACLHSWEKGAVVSGEGE